MRNYAEELIYQEENPLIHIINPYTEKDFRKCLSRVRNNPITPDQFITSIVSQVATATFGVGLFSAILGALLVAWISKAKTRMEAPDMPPPPKWVAHMTKTLTEANPDKKTYEIAEEIKILWGMKPKEKKMEIYEREYGVSAYREVK